MATVASLRPPWRKVLYLRQPYDDNHVDASFLAEMSVNANLKEYQYSTTCLNALAVVRQISLITVFLCIFARAQDGAWSHGPLLGLDVLLLLAVHCLGAAARQASSSKAAVAIVVSEVWRVGLMAVPLWLLAPTLRTLTRSWSDDTIVALTVGLLAAHVLLYDYSSLYASGVLLHADSSHPLLPVGAGALNAAMFAATILASRLSSDEQVFAFMGLALVLFALVPAVSRQLRRIWPTSHDLLATPLLALVAMFLLRNSPALGIFVGVIVVASIVGPALFLWLQRYKLEIQGPWDERAYVSEGTS